MGPDCGTAIIDGVPLGFANAIPRGTIGVIGASGTGMQAVMPAGPLGDRHLSGDRTGSRDMTAEVGAVRHCRHSICCRATRHSRSRSGLEGPAPGVADQVVAALAACGKPGVADFLGHSPAEPPRQVSSPACSRTCSPVARLTGGDWPTGPLESG